MSVLKRVFINKQQTNIKSNNFRHTLEGLAAPDLNFFEHESQITPKCIYFHTFNVFSSEKCVHFWVFRSDNWSPDQKLYTLLDFQIEKLYTLLGSNLLIFKNCLHFGTQIVHFRTLFTLLGPNLSILKKLFTLLGSNIVHFRKIVYTSENSIFG